MQLGIVDDETKVRELADLLKQIENDLLQRWKQLSENLSKTPFKLDVASIFLLSDTGQSWVKLR